MQPEWNPSSSKFIQVHPSSSKFNVFVVDPDDYEGTAKELAKCWTNTPSRRVVII
jgi:hypothetical protein